MRTGERKVIRAVRFPGKSSSAGSFVLRLKPFFFGQQFKKKKKKLKRQCTFAPDPDGVIVYPGADTKSILPPPIDDLFQ